MGNMEKMKQLAGKICEGLADGSNQGADQKLLSVQSRELLKMIEEYEQEYIDIREFCANYNQALCITDAEGIIVYMNRQYSEQTGLDRNRYIGKYEPAADPISKRVIQTNRTVSFGNAGATTPSRTGRFVAGIPIFDSDHKLKNVVITLAPESEVYRRFKELKGLMNQQQAVRVSENGDEEASSLLGKDPAIKEIRSQIRKVAPTDATVLIIGESGTGKEVISDCIQELSARKGRPYVKINCAAIPSNMLEAELFGFEKGSFTGATSQKIGLFEIANHGTIMLDEIGDFPIELQPKLLRVLQQGEMYRIGNNKPIKLDVRVLAATNVNLREKMLSGKFREDLYYRLNVFPIQVPPLRERADDIPGFIQYFHYEYCKKYDRVLHMSDDIIRLLCQYDWPGNVRELQNVVEYYVICSEEGNEMDVKFLSQILQKSSMEDSAYDQALDGEGEVHTGRKENPTVSAESRLGAGIDVPLEFTGEKTLFELRDNYEKLLIEDALKRTSSGNKAAKLLGIYPSSLYRKAQKYGIKYDEED